MSPMVIGSVGVGLLLLAFVLNISKKLSETGATYLAMNFAGAGLAAWYAYAGGLVPFIILEGVWGGFALFKLIGVLANKKDSPR